MLAVLVGRRRRRWRGRLPVHDSRRSPNSSRATVTTAPPGTQANPQPAGPRHLVRVVGTGRRRTALWAAVEPVRARGAGSRRAGGDVRGRPARRPDAPAGAVVKSLASAMCIGSGGSVGREGPIVQIGSALGLDRSGSSRGCRSAQLRLLVACGAAGGISATFNAPIAGVFFALELILRNFATRSFGRSVLSSITADAIGRAVFGSHPFLPLPAFPSAHRASSCCTPASGCSRAVVGIGVHARPVRRRGRSRDWSVARPGVASPGSRRPAARGSCCWPCRRCTASATRCSSAPSTGRYVDPGAARAARAKILATSLTMGIGGSGGVFAPSLFMGAMLGSAYGALAHSLLPGHRGRPGRVRPGRHGRGVRRDRARADHGGDRSSSS